MYFLDSAVRSIQKKLKIQLKKTKRYQVTHFDRELHTTVNILFSHVCQPIGFSDFYSRLLQTPRKKLNRLTFTMVIFECNKFTDRQRISNRVKYRAPPLAFVNKTERWWGVDSANASDGNRRFWEMARVAVTYRILWRKVWQLSLSFNQHHF